MTQKRGRGCVRFRSPSESESELATGDGRRGGGADDAAQERARVRLRRFDTLNERTLASEPCDAAVRTVRVKNRPW